MTRLNEEQLINLFHEPRTASSFTEEPVTDEQLRRIQELTFYGPAAELSAHLQAGYFITAIRALGLDAGPMTGADFVGIRKEFFADNAEIPFLIVNLGHGEGPAYPRGARFSYDEVTRSL